MTKQSVMTLAALLLATQAMADEGKCSFGGTKLADDCSAIGWAKEGDFYDGCCTGTGLIWCEQDGTALCGANCPQNEQVCGWNDGGYYWCVEEPNPDPSGAMPFECPATCTPQCDGKQCGFDGCAGFCGNCGEGTFCTEDGQCQACSCDGKQCGADECGESCGTCEKGTYCSESQCLACSCEGKECGANECNEPCGTCTGGLGCTEQGTCVEVPSQCTEKDEPGCSGCAEEACVCGEDDFCCTTGWDFICVAIWDDCATEQECACVPDCDGQVCGSDGCGGACGTCEAGTACVADGSKCLPCSCEGKD